MSSFIFRYESYARPYTKNHENVALSIYTSAIENDGVFYVLPWIQEMQKTDFYQLEMILEHDKPFEPLTNI